MDGQWMHVSVKLFSCLVPLPFETRCTSWGCSDKAEVSELKQTSLHITVLSKQPARVWGRDQQAVILLTAPCFIPLCYMEPETKPQAGECLVSGLQHLQVNSEGFPCCAVLYQDVGQLEKELEQKYSNQNSCAPEDVKSSYNHLWNQRLTSSLSGKLLPPDGDGKQGTEPD